MKRPILAVALVAAVFAIAVGAALGIKAWNGEGSTTALAASTGQNDIFSAAVAGQETDADETPWLGAQVKLTSNGLTIAAVIADSPADKAGLQRGDVITAVDGAAVEDMKALLSAIRDKNVGDALTLSILREGATQDVTVTLEPRPEPLPEAHPFLPELNDIPRDELYSHILGGSFQFTDKDGQKHTLSVDLGTVSAVDADAGTITVDLNAGGTQTYTVSDDALVRPDDLSVFEGGERVAIIFVDGSVRAVIKGGGCGMLPFFGGRGGRGGFGGGPGMMGPGMRGLDLPAPDGASGLDLPARSWDRSVTEG